MLVSRRHPNETYAQQKRRLDGYGNDTLTLLTDIVADGDSHPDVVVTTGDGVNACYVETLHNEPSVVDFAPAVTVTTIEHDSTVRVHASRVALCRHIDYTACDVCGGTAVVVPPMWVPARCGKTECQEA